MIFATAQDAADFLLPRFAEQGGEKIVVVHLDAGQRLIGVEEVQGEREDVALPIRLILAEALRLGASGMIVAHNHPSGNPAPSDADIAATRELASMAAILEIRLHDHLIFGRDGECRSMRALALL